MHTRVDHGHEKWIPVTLLLAVSTVMLIICYTPVPWWDGIFYYDDFLVKYRRLFVEHNVDITFLISGLKLGTHAGHPIILLASLGQMIAGWNGVYAVQSLLILLSDYCLYRLIEKAYPRLNKYLVALACAAYSISPYISGLGYEFGPYIFCTVFVVFTLYFYTVKKSYFLTTIFLIAVYLSLETGIILVGSYILTDLVLEFIKVTKENKTKSFFERLRLVLPIKKFILLLIPELIILIPGVWYYPGYSVTTGSKEINNLGFNIFSVVMHFRQSFVSNLFWVFWVTLLIATLLVYKMKFKLSIDKHITLPVAIMYLLYSLFMCFFFVSTPCPRYSQLMTILYPFIAATAYSLLYIKRKIVSYIVASCLSVLLIIQNFFTIDISSYTLYNIDLGNTKVYSPSTNTQAIDVSVYYVNELYAYNQQAAYGCNLLNDIYSYYDLDGNTIVGYSYFIYYDILGTDSICWNPDYKTITIGEDKDNLEINLQDIKESNKFKSCRCILILMDQMVNEPEKDVKQFMERETDNLIECREFNNAYGKYYVFLYEFN